MSASGYQVEWLIHQRRRWRGLVRMVEERLFPPHDPVELSRLGSEQAHAHAAPPPRAKEVPARAEGEVWPADLADPTQYPPAVDYELERRAGSFMRPKYPPGPAPSNIPKIRRKEAEEGE